MDKEHLLSIVAEIQEHDKQFKITPRNLLEAFGFSKRTKWNVVRIDTFLEEHKLETDPNYTDTWVDADITLRHKKKAKSRKDNDPIQRVMLLPAANKPPVSVQKEASVSEAMTLMMMHNYSQLPVMNGQRHVFGVITWETIGYGITNGIESSKVIDFVKKDVAIVGYDAPILDAVQRIIKHDFALVQKSDNTISGIVTIADISTQFINFTEPFLLLEQIENHIRQLLDGRFLVEELRDICNSTDRDRVIEYIDDLTFGEYVSIVENPDNWEKLQLSIERSHFIKYLDKVRKIRNDVMHFDPEGITAEQREDLLKMSNFLMELRKYT